MTNEAWWWAVPLPAQLAEQQQTHYWLRNYTCCITKLRCYHFYIWWEIYGVWLAFSLLFCLMFLLGSNNTILKRSIFNYTAVTFLNMIPTIQEFEYCKNPYVVRLRIKLGTFFMFSTRLETCMYCPIFRWNLREFRISFAAVQNILVSKIIKYAEYVFRLRNALR